MIYYVYPRHERVVIATALFFVLRKLNTVLYKITTFNQLCTLIKRYLHKYLILTSEQTLDIILLTFIMEWYNLL